MMYEAAGMNDELYQVPLSQFTTARDALVARLKAAGNDSAAADAKRARKPSVAAWAANQVVWHARAEWARLQAAAEALRKKHEKATSPEELRQAVREQREALQACEARAAELLAKHGHDAGTGVLQKVSRTLLALATARRVSRRAAGSRAAAARVRGVHGADAGGPPSCAGRPHRRSLPRHSVCAVITRIVPERRSGHDSNEGSTEGR